jgi:hypothetical protein
MVVLDGRAMLELSLLLDMESVREVIVGAELLPVCWAEEVTGPVAERGTRW